MYVLAVNQMNYAGRIAPPQVGNANWRSFGSNARLHHGSFIRRVCRSLVLEFGSGPGSKRGD
jgi:hypothetical protein